jgi:hypothetical protein
MSVIDAWLTAIGALLLSIGTGAQAWSALAEFKSLRAALLKADPDNLRRLLSPMSDPFAPAVMVWAKLDSRRPRGFWARAWRQIKLRPRRWWVDHRGSWYFRFYKLLRLSAAAREAQSKGGENAVELARFMRQALLWTVLMVGSMLVLAASADGLVRLY